MTLSPRYLMEFMRGMYQPWQVIAFVPGEYAARIGGRSSDLRIHREYALKLRHKHRFRYDHFTMIQTAINDGWVVIERKNLVFVLAVEAPLYATFALVVKREARGDELWLKTFHQIDPTKLRRLLRDGEMLRVHRGPAPPGLVEDE